MIRNVVARLTLSISLLAGLSGCGGDGSSFSLLQESDTFIQSLNSVNNKVDIVWMVDGSGTMANHQSNLATNFGDFITEFTTKSIDYRMVVASTDAWVRELNYNAGGCSGNPNPTNNPAQIYVSSADCGNTLATYGMLTEFRDGDIYGAIGGAPGVRSGVYLLSSLMPVNTVLSTFATNIRTGTRGDGSREGVFSSLRSVLRRNADGSVGYGGETHTALSSFRRPEAFLAVIVVSDEDDQSRKTDNTTYASISEYVTAFQGFMDGYTQVVDNVRRYNISSVVVDNLANCVYGLHPQAAQGDRYVAVSQATDGIVANICSPDFSQDLEAISEQILSLASRFKLSRVPIPSTIVVTVNGVQVPQSSTNGWSYVVENNSHYVQFHGPAIPQTGSQISVVFDPVAYGS
jgi:hypothetical protein